MGVLGLTAEEERQAADALWSKLLAGVTEEDIQAEMGLASADYAALRAVAFERAGETLRAKPPEIHFLDYLLNQTRNLRDLSDMVAAWRVRDEEGRARVVQPAAFVSAVKVKAEILDKIIQWGRELGLIQTSQSGGVVPGVNVKDLSSKELRGLVARELAQLDRIVARFGEADLADVQPGPLYQEADQGKVKAHNRVPVHGGRRKVIGIGKP
jgi:hypothetical protein